jgi:Calcium binding
MKGKRPKKAMWSKEELESLVEEATVDCYNESEQVCGLYTMMENDLALPFETEILGIAVVVEKIDLTERDEIVAICKRGGKRQRIPLLDVPLPSPPPAGAQWIAAYRHWAEDAHEAE